VVERGSEILPRRRVWTGIVRGEQERHHEQEAARAGRSNANSQKQSDADGEFAIGDKEGDRRGVRNNETAQHRRHEGIGAIREKSVDPELKAAV